MTEMTADPDRREFAHEALVRRVTMLDAPPAVPEILILIAINALSIWQEVDEATDDPRAKRPYWAFAWPGGIAKARYLLDHPEVVRGRHVLDIGSGSGIASIAAMKAGAASVVANDVDPLAAIAARIAAEANGVVIETSTEDLLGDVPDGVDLVMMADVVYEPELQIRVGAFVEVARRRNIPVLFGDRGTTRLPKQPLAKLFELEATPFPELEIGYFERGIIWRLV